MKGFKSEYATDQENMRLVFARARMTTPCLVVLEDLDSMIDDKSRAFFLNELDGFETNIFLSSMMQWMAMSGLSMNKIILGQATQLREQMAASAKSPAVSQ